MLAAQANGSDVLTIEGLAQDGKLHPIQEAFAEEGAAQCGYCTPGFIMRTYAFLQEHPHPDEEEIRAALAGNICRCTGYVKPRSEEHTSELQSLTNLVCRLLL